MINLGFIVIIVLSFAFVIIFVWGIIYRPIPAPIKISTISKGVTKSCTKELTTCVNDTDCQETCSEQYDGIEMGCTTIPVSTLGLGGVVYLQWGGTVYVPTQLMQQQKTVLLLTQVYVWVQNPGRNKQTRRLHGQLHLVKPQMHHFVLVQVVQLKLQMTVVIPFVYPLVYKAGIHQSQLELYRFRFLYLRGYKNLI